MKKTSKFYPLLPTPADKREGWEPKEELPALHFEQEKNNTISLSELESPEGPVPLYRLDVRYDSPGFEGGSAENLSRVEFIAQIPALDGAISIGYHSVEAETFRGSLYIPKDPKPGDIYWATLKIALYYSDDPYVPRVIFEAPKHSVKFVK